jgi:hypothetical protein
MLWPVLIFVCLTLTGCGRASNPYQIGQTYQPATNHSSWTKQNQHPRQSGAHGKYVTIYANDSANQVKQQGGLYKPGATILKETFSDPSAPATEQMFIMEKGAAGSAPRSNDWIWIVTDKSGKITASGEDAALNGRRCAMCHAGS